MRKVITEKLEGKLGSVCSILGMNLMLTRREDGGLQLIEAGVR